MAISNIGGIPYGRSFELKTSKLEATKKIVSDGKVDEAFQSSEKEFISEITDSRVHRFLSSNASPGDGWEPHELGGFDSQTQSLFVEDDRVVLRSNTEEDGKLVQHRIEAPFNPSTGKVSLTSSTEGFQIADSSPGKQASFKIPLG